MVKIKKISVRKFKTMFNCLTQNELAKALGVSQPAIAYYAKKFGVSKTRAKKLKFTK
jgi:predicted transcriptional regulator